MMLHIAVVDDNLEMQNLLKEYIHTFEQENNERFRTSFFSDGDELMDEFTVDYDVIFLDIQMKRLSGMETAKKIREVDTKVIIIFITNMANYAIHGYAVDAMNYILKPVTFFTFSEQLKKAIEKVKHKEKNYLFVPVKLGNMRLSSDDIVFIETAPKRMLTIHTIDATYEIQSTLKEMEKQLATHDFARCNNCYLVNLKYVSGIVKNDAIVGTHTLQISRPRKKAFMDELTEYLGRL